ncbi:TetR/AcrR family transcriptional regulator [Amylibacter sp. SFDW26]|uniref:TetR/AcrR family transcriptional regulator n=1 Tax=Amylibacter sp. SFDW26 TaxID=2652722 RepID=UPI0012617763|nr:TetR/AcrR family transcriptional regulator [Amylibacter sp. SFDW26]KAB7613848.1 TetR/AcrR family transcriptional regulator [Amylibacter sp. SFDW26]
MARLKGSVGAETKVAILSTALPMIAQYGYSAVSMRQIAEAVGVNVSALYNHFPNKQQILLRLMIDHMDSLMAAWDNQDIRGKTAQEQLEIFTRFHIRFNVEKPKAVFISFMELRSLEPEGHKTIEKQRRVYEDILRDIIRSGINSGVFHTSDAHVAAMSVLGSLNGVNTWFRAEGRMSQKEIEDTYVDLTLRSVGYEIKGT